MRRLVLLAAVYALAAALVLPGTLLAQDAAAPETPAPAEQPALPGAGAGEDAAGAEDPAAAEEPAPAEVPADEAPAEEPPEPEPAAPPEPAPAPPEAAPPEPQLLADERAERPKARAAQSGAVVISDFQYAPATITVQQGDTVTWTNDGPTPHSATADDGSFDTGIFPAGESRSHTFTQAGTFAYFCTPHPNMRGTVVVNAAQSDADTPTSDDDASGGGGTGGGTTGGEAAQTGAGPTLPNSGGESQVQLAVGALLLLLGALGFQRLRPREPRPAGRIGW
jgi:plastocyanin